MLVDSLKTRHKNPPVSRTGRRVSKGLRGRSRSTSRHLGGFDTGSGFAWNADRRLNGVFERRADPDLCPSDQDLDRRDVTGSLGAISWSLFP